MKYLRLLTPLVAAFLLPAVQPGPEKTGERPACTSAARGRMWPENANFDARAQRQYARCGMLEMCVFTGWRHKWQKLTVHVGQLSRNTGRPDGCLLELAPEARTTGAKVPRPE